MSCIIWCLIQDNITRLAGDWCKVDNSLDMTDTGYHPSTFKCWLYNRINEMIIKMLFLPPCHWVSPKQRHRDEVSRAAGDLDFEDVNCNHRARPLHH